VCILILLEAKDGNAMMADERSDNITETSFEPANILPVYLDLP
jgi:hypothetical protein